MHERDCSLEMISMPLRDWSQAEVLESVRDCFVTGKWKDSEDAEILLQNDDQSMNFSYNNVSRFYICVLCACIYMYEQIFVQVKTLFRTKLKIS